MRYMVMECHLSYAVVLDENGRFLKVANMHYQPGQIVTDVIEMQISRSTSHKNIIPKWIYPIAAAAACLVIGMTSLFQTMRVPHASVYMAINPEVRIDVNKKDVVIGLEGTNDDGEQLIEGYRFKRKELDQVCSDLADLAIAQDYLHDGGHIALRLDTDDEQWIASHSDQLASRLHTYLEDKISVTIEVTDTQSIQVVIPLETAPLEDHYDENDYGEISAHESEDIPEKPVLPDDKDDDDGQTDYDDRGADPQASQPYVPSTESTAPPTEPAVPPVQPTSPPTQPAALPIQPTAPSSPPAPGISERMDDTDYGDDDTDYGSDGHNGDDTDYGDSDDDTDYGDD